MYMLKKSLLNVRMLFALIICFVILFYNLYSGGYLFDLSVYEPTMDILQMYTMPYATSSFVIFVALFPPMPYAYSFIEERNSGYLKFIMTRVSRKKYAVQKIWLTGLSGGLAAMIPSIFIFIILDIYTVDTTAANHPPIFEQLMWAPYIYIWGGRFVLLLKAILLFLFGFMWSELALLVSLIIKNKYVAFVVPFFIYQMTWIALSGNFVPISLVRGDYALGMPVFAPYLCELIYIAVLSAGCFYLLKRQGRK